MATVEFSKFAGILSAALSKFFQKTKAQDQMASQENSVKNLEKS